jgi:hypothetical protein
MATTQAPMTLADFLRLPETSPALELMDGVVSQKASPKGSHATLQPMLWLLFYPVPSRAWAPPQAPRPTAQPASPADPGGGRWTTGKGGAT